MAQGCSSLTGNPRVDLVFLTPLAHARTAAFSTVSPRSFSRTRIRAKPAQKKNSSVLAKPLGWSFHTPLAKGANAIYI